jgi:hypothetical protein
MFSLLAHFPKVGFFLSVCLSVWQRKCNNSRIVGHVVFYIVHVLSRECLWVCLCIPPIAARQWLCKHVPTATELEASFSLRFVLYQRKVGS